MSSLLLDTLRKGPPAILIPVGFSVWVSGYLGFSIETCAGLSIQVGLIDNLDWAMSDRSDFMAKDVV